MRGVAVADEAPGRPAGRRASFAITYQGFTAKYSCDGLSGRIKEVLLLLGARKQDLRSAPTGCTGGFGRPTLFPGVAVKMSVLAPLDDKSAPRHPAGRRRCGATLTCRGREPLAAAGDCELTEQIKQTILPLFTTRNVEYKSTCVPHQLTPGGTTLKADVLVSAAATRGAGAPAG